tara:strand:+ start:4370 stop:4540 length:171 start_codon:yes stop_codon:yes gene_type:complete
MIQYMLVHMTNTPWFPIEFWQNLYAGILLPILILLNVFFREVIPVEITSKSGETDV